MLQMKNGIDQVLFRDVYFKIVPEHREHFCRNQARQPRGHLPPSTYKIKFRFFISIQMSVDLNDFVCEIGIFVMFWFSPF